MAVGTSTPTYAFIDGFTTTVTAANAMAALGALANSFNSTPEQIVAAATPPDNAMHAIFEWVGRDYGQADGKYGFEDQKERAQALLRSISLTQVVMAMAGVPTASEVASFTAIDPFTIPANFSGSSASLSVAATASTVFVVKQNGTQIGTITFAISGTTGTFSTQAAVQIATGDILTVVAPAIADSTAAGLSATLVVGR